MKILKLIAFFVIFAFSSVLFYKTFPQFDNRHAGFIEGVIWCLFYDVLFGFQIFRRNE